MLASAAKFAAVLLVFLCSAGSASGSNVLTLTEKNFNNSVAKHSFLVVEFYAPWCGHCKTLQPEWEKAATSLKADKSIARTVTLGKVDVTKEVNLGSRFKILSFPTIKIFVDGSMDPEDYDGPREAVGIVSNLKQRVDPNFKPPAPEGSDHVLVLTAANFDKTIAAHPLVMVDFYAPWCGHCKTLEPEFSKAAGILAELEASGGPVIKLAKVDATVEKDLAAKFEVKGYPTVKIFDQSSTTQDKYEGKREAAAIVDVLKSRAGPPSTELLDAAQAEKIKAESRVLAVYAGDDASELAEWVALAKELRAKLKFAHTTSKPVLTALGIEDGIWILKNFDERIVSFDGKVSDTDELKRFINIHRFELAMKIRRGDREALKIFFEDEARPSLFLFLDSDENPKDQVSLAAFREAARDARESMVSGFFNFQDFPEVFDLFSVKQLAMRGHLPLVLIELRKTGARFLMKGNVTQESVAGFIYQYQQGELTPYIKTLPEPENNTGPVRVVVGTTYERDVSNAGKWVLLDVFAPWCGHCKTLAPIFEQVGEAFAGVEGVSIAKVDATENDIPKSLGVQSFPTILLFRGDGTPPETFSENDRSLRRLVEYVTEKSGVQPSPSYVPPPPPPPPPPANPSLSEEEEENAPTATAAPDVDEGLLGRFRQLSGREVQVPWMPAGYTVPGAYLMFAAACLVLCIVLAATSVFSSGDAAPAKQGKPAAAAAATASKSKGKTGKSD